MQNNRAPLLCYFKKPIQTWVTVRKRPPSFRAVDLEIWRMTLQNNRAPLQCYFKLCASFRSHRWIQTWVTVQKRPIWVKFDDCDLEIWRMTLGEFKLELQSRNAQSGSKSTIFRACDFEIWRMTLKNNRAPLLSNMKLYTSFHHHMWIQTGVTIRKRLSWVATSVTLTFDLWPWPFAWTLPWSVVITPENFVMIRWWEHSQKGVTDRQTDGQTDRQKIPFLELLGRS